MSILGPNPFRPPTGAELFAPLSLRLGLTTLEIHASPTWGSSQPEHRKLLHAAVLKRVEELGCKIARMAPYPVSVPADLSQASKDIPRSISISVSHALDVGGFALLSSHEGIVGFDIEGLDRVKDAVAKRIRHVDEKVPDDLANGLYWSAKEASFKALRGPSQPAVLSDLRLAKWEPSAETGPNVEVISQFFAVKIPKGIQGLGLALAEKTHALSIFIQQPST